MNSRFFIMILAVVSFPVCAGEVTFSEQSEFINSTEAIATATGVAKFCGNSSDEKALYQSVVSIAMDSRLSKGGKPHDATRELIQVFDIHVTGITKGLLIAKLPDFAKASVCKQGSEQARKLLNRSGP